MRFARALQLQGFETYQFGHIRFHELLPQRSIGLKEYRKAILDFKSKLKG